jgi:hypothetical protein
MAGKRITDASTAGNWRSGRGRGAGSSRGETACRRCCRGDEGGDRAAIIGGRATTSSGFSSRSDGRSARNRRAARFRGDAGEQRVVALRSACSSPYAGSSAAVGRADQDDVAGLIQPRPFVVVYSSPRARHELHADADAEEGPARRAPPPQRLDHAGHGIEAARQSAKAPTPGSTMRSALATRPGRRSGDGASMPASRAARSKALAAECRLPEP